MTIPFSFPDLREDHERDLQAALLLLWTTLDSDPDNVDLLKNTTETLAWLADLCEATEYVLPILSVAAKEAAMVVSVHHIRNALAIAGVAGAMVMQSGFKFTSHIVDSMVPFLEWLEPAVGLVFDVFMDEYPSAVFVDLVLFMALVAEWANVACVVPSGFFYNRDKWSARIAQLVGMSTDQAATAALRRYGAVLEKAAANYQRVIDTLSDRQLRHLERDYYTAKEGFDRTVHEMHNLLHKMRL